MDALVRDFRFAVRGLIKSPFLALVIVLALALGIGANTAIFSVLHGVLLAPLPYPEPESLVRLIDAAPEYGVPRFSSSPADFADWRREARSFTDLSAWRRANLNLTADGAEPDRLAAVRATAGFFEIMGLPLALGRSFSADEDQPDAARVVVLGYDFWQRRFGADAGVIGSTLSLDGEPHTVIGVAPAKLDFPDAVDVWVPLAMEITEELRGNHFVLVIGRLRPGVSLEAAQSEMETISRRLVEAYPETNEGWTVKVHRLGDLLVEGVATALWVLMAAVLMVLLIAAANVANVLLARAAARGREVSLRAALGAGRGGLLRLFLVESVLLAVVGGVFGLLLAWWGTRWLLTLSAGSIPRVEEVGLSGTVVAFTFFLAVATGLLFGLWPALLASKADLRGALTDGGRGSVGRRGSHLVRQLLVSLEVAVAVVLLVAAGLLLASFLGLRSVSPGFTTDGILTATVSLPEAKYDGEGARRTFFREISAELVGLPGVVGAGIIAPLPMSRSNSVLSYSVENRPPVDPGEAPIANIRSLTPGTLETLEVPLVRGRLFAWTDGEGARPVALINQTLARQMWPGTEDLPGDPLEARITFGDPADAEVEWLSIVGVVGDIRPNSLEMEPRAEIYLPLLQSSTDQATLLLKGQGRRLPEVAPVRSAVRRIDPALPLYRVISLREVVASTYAQEQFMVVVVGLFAAIALVLAAIGVYGVVSYTVAQRSHEMGLRMALGSPKSAVMSLIVSQSMVPVLIGLVVGALTAWLVGRLLEGLLFGVSPSDPTTLIAVLLLLAATALLAICLPALRAVRADPMVVLREE